MANTYKNIVITPNTNSSTGDPSIQFSGGNTSVNTDVSVRVYPDSNGTVSFEAAAGQLLSITNDLTATIFTVNDVSGIPLVEVNVTSQQITFGQFYGNVGIGTAAGTSSTYKLDCNGSANISSPTLLVAGSNVLSLIAGVNTNVASAYAFANGVNTNVAAAFAKANTVNANAILNNATTLITTGYSVLTFNAGANVAAYTTWTPDPANGNYQFANSNGSLTIAAPTNNCAIDILFTNGLGGAGNGAGAVIFSGYISQTGGGGDTYATTANNRFILSIRKINGIATYAWKALQ